MKRKRLIIFCFLLILVIIFFAQLQVLNYIEAVVNSYKRKMSPIKIPLGVSVHIWAKAAIADYLWFHLLKGNLRSSDGFYRRGNVTMEGIEFQYYSGPGYVQNTLPQKVEYLVLVLNARSPEHVRTSEIWLNYIPRLPALKKLAIVLLGSETCRYKWIQPHLKSNGGLIDVLFMVYDSPLVDNVEVFQWPLGVATYRNFPVVNIIPEKYQPKRKYICNFAGTVYKDSSRAVLRDVMTDENFHHRCYLGDRDEWPSKETRESLSNYIEKINESDFTLCPAGMNTECYRIYEAMSLGSIPIIEDVMTKGSCVSPLRLLKKYNPPVVFIKDWLDLNETLLFYEKQHYNIPQMRRNVLKWYANFKKTLASHFINTIKEKFFLNYS